jgi:hypothetical protein
MIMQHQTTDKLFLPAIYLTIPLILILLFIIHAESLLDLSGLNIFLTAFLHHGFSFLAGNIISWLILFPGIVVLGWKVSEMKIIVPILIIGTPFVSYLIQMLARGSYNFQAWGFSGIVFAVYGCIVALTLIGAAHHIEGYPKYPAMVIIFFVSLIPVFCVPSMIDLQNGYYLCISTTDHQIGYLWGLTLTAVAYLINCSMFKDVQNWKYGLIWIAFQILSFLMVIL